MVMVDFTERVQQTSDFEDTTKGRTDGSHAAEAGCSHAKQATELGAALTGEAARRPSDDELTVFDSTGLAIQDLAIALAALDESASLADRPRVDL